MPKGSKIEQERRERAIMEIIQRREARTQSEIVKKLEGRGIYTTQATVSRFLQDHQLVKNNEGKYVLTTELEREQKEYQIRSELSKYAAGTLMPLQVMMIPSQKNHAAALAATIEDCGQSGVLGTLVAGDKVLILFDGNADGELSIQAIRDYLGS